MRTVDRIGTRHVRSSARWRMAGTLLAAIGLASTANAESKARTGRAPVPSQRSEPVDDLAAAVEQLAHGDLTKAMNDLSRLYEATGRASLLCYLAQGAEKQRRSVAAYDLFGRCVEEADRAKEPLDPVLLSQAQRALGVPPGQSADVVVTSRKGGTIWLDERLVARIPPGGSVQLTVEPGEHVVAREPGTATGLRLRCGAQSASEVDLDRGQVSASESLFLLPLQKGGTLDEGGLGRLASWLTAPLRKEHGLLLSAKRIQDRLREQADAVRCLPRHDCQVRLGRAADASFLLGVEVGRASGAEGEDRPITAWLIELRTGTETARSTASCRACSEETLASSVATQVLKLWSEGRTPPRQREILSSPKGTLRVDGVAHGQTPKTLWLLPGTHTIGVERRYFVSEQKQIEVAEDATEKIPQVLLQLQPAPRSAGERATRGFGIGLSALGGVLLAGGVGLSLAPSTPTGEVIPGQPLMVSDYQQPGRMLLLGGGAALVTGVTLLLVDRHRQRQRRAR